MLVRSYVTFSTVWANKSTSMSILRWLQAKQNHPLLPNPGGNKSVVAANKAVSSILVEKAPRKRGPYHHYDGELRAKIAKYACENGNKSAIAKFSSTLSYALSEGTVMVWKSLKLMDVNM